MQEEPKILGILSEKTRKDIEKFVSNSFLSEDQEKKRIFYEIIQKTIVDVTCGCKIRSN
jgi:hypothetical protein